MQDNAKIGDLVKLKYPGLDENSTGIILDIFTLGSQAKWAHVLWSGDGNASEKVRDLRIVNDGKKE
ncbi:MAG: hypothetical protein CME70_19450 [Halobacteriovorax sp.]|nr:hypothetical protein [Halobacteriovorax sp.]MBK26183.1 hypothetical protein [Halobacteriovorax sp.]|tara:strand:+ start:452 stop:649 length:198 start_codon:yes stop_codon:yes gene_type:complete